MSKLNAMDLPKFEVTVLDNSEISLVSGGELDMQSCTCGTASQCSTDGSNEHDTANNSISDL